MAKLVWVLLLTAAGAAGQRVEGTVVDSSSGDGIPGVTVEVIRASNLQGLARAIDVFEGKAIYSTDTDAQGRFRFSDVADGAYTIRYRAPGYQDAAWAPTRNPQPPPRFQVSASTGNPVELKARMIHMGRITGRLVNDKGEGVPHGRLDLSGETLMLSVDTDTEGKFSLQVSPGYAYTLGVLPQLNWKPPDPEPGSGRALGWARTYYPGVATPEAAAKIVLPPGGELTGIEIRLQTLPAHAIRGVLLDPAGSPVPKVAISLGEDARTPALKAESKSDGAFEFPVVIDGPWRFSAELERSDVKLRAAAWREMAGRDIDDLKLRLESPFTVHVRVVAEAPEGWPAPKIPAMRLTRKGIGQSPLLEPPLPLRAGNGNNFRFEPVYPGVYEFNRLVSGPPEGYYLDAVRLGERDLTAPDVELSSGTLPLTLVYKRNGGTVRGAVEQCAHGGVVLIPQDPALRWPTVTHSSRCDEKDRFEISSVRPGEYYAQAFALDASAELWEPKFDEGLLNQATKITVRAGEATAADLRVIARR